MAFCFGFGFVSSFFGFLGFFSGLFGLLVRWGSHQTRDLGEAEPTQKGHYTPPTSPAERRRPTPEIQQQVPSCVVNSFSFPETKEGQTSSLPHGHAGWWRVGVKVLKLPSFSVPCGYPPLFLLINSSEFCCCFCCWFRFVSTRWYPFLSMAD